MSDAETIEADAHGTGRGDPTWLTKATMRLTSDGRPSARKRGYTFGGRRRLVGSY